MNIVFRIDGNVSSLLEEQLKSNQLDQGLEAYQESELITLIRPSTRYNIEEASKIARLFCDRLGSKTPLPDGQKEVISSFLQVEVTRYQKPLNQEIPVKENSKHLSWIVRLDIFFNTFQYRENKYENRSPYLTKSASSHFELWQKSMATFAAEKTKLSQKPSSAPVELLSQNDATEAFLRHPIIPLWMMKHRLINQMGRFNVTLAIDENYQLLHQSKPMITIMRTLNKGKNTDLPELHYRQVENNFVRFDPRKWDKLPIFRKKDSRKTSDYRVEVHSVLQETHGHVWLELKDPEGNIYNVGWCDGALVAGDPHEFRYQDELQDTLKTRYVITKENFEALKAAIEASKKEESPWRNSLEWTTAMLSQIHIDLPMSHSLNHWIFKIPIFGWMVFGLCWLISKGMGLFETSEERFLHQLEIYRQFQQEQGSNKVV